MAITNQFSFDELNVISKSELIDIIRKTRKGKRSGGSDGEEDEPKQRSMPYRQFFGEMYLDPEEKERRIKMANDLEYVFLFLFAYVATYGGLGDLTFSYVYTEVETAYWDVITKYIDEDTVRKFTKEEMQNSIKDYISRQTRYVVDNTVERVDDDYFTSVDRATLVAENQTNGVANAEGLYDALDEGYTHKTWVTMQDNRVRDTHMEVDGTTIPIDEAFQVGGSELLFPGDDSLGADASELANCRCTVEYSYGEPGEIW